jgi:hypothetical protein
MVNVFWTGLKHGFGSQIGAMLASAVFGMLMASRGNRDADPSSASPRGDEGEE